MAKSHLTYKSFKKKHPGIYARVRKEVEDFYASLGVQLQYGYRKFELPTMALVEGEPLNYGELQMYAKAFIDEAHEVDVPDELLGDVPL